MLYGTRRGKGHKRAKNFFELPFTNFNFNFQYFYFFSDCPKRSVLKTKNLRRKCQVKIIIFFELRDNLDKVFCIFVCLRTISKTFLLLSQTIAILFFLNYKRSVQGELAREKKQRIGITSSGTFQLSLEKIKHNMTILIL